MPSLSRRTLLQAAAVGSAIAMLPASIQRALAIPANNQTGTIRDVEHVVILMQENRSFDHYFGTLPGVRGFGDRLTIPLPEGRSVWQQQGEEGVISPYHLDSRKGNAQRVHDTPHSWKDAQAAWDSGRLTSWPTYKTPTSMGYYERYEIPFQFALANAFTLCDAYHCSLLGGTAPNRLFFWTGTNGPTGSNVAAVVNEWDGPGVPDEGYDWKTYAERLEENGVSWKIYQYLPDNFGDNAYAGFRQYREASVKVGNPAQPAADFTDFVVYREELDAVAPLYKGNGNTMPAADSNDLETMLESFRRDVRTGKLPQVSWLVAPAAYSEHPGPSSPVQGGWYTQEVLNALTENPEVWSKTVLLVNYDENDGFFDHVPPPAAPSFRADGTLAGKSTVTFDTEVFQHKAPPGSKEQPTPDGRVYGPGQRVPLFVISPWSRGGWANSQVFDHTSVLQFLEQRFNVKEPNISPWRRAVCGDLTSAFNFINPNDEFLPPLQTTSRRAADKLRESQEQLPQVPVPAGDHKRPRQRQQARPSRALPYHIEVEAEPSSDSHQLTLTMRNTGQQGIVIHVYDKLHLNEIPRRYTIESGKLLSDVWSPKEGDNGAYDLWLLGPNGYHRALKGNLASRQPEVRLEHDGKSHTFLLTITNAGMEAVNLQIDRCPYTSTGPWHFQLGAGATHQQQFSTRTSGGWYDLTIRADQDSWERRLAGRLETGLASISDPLLGNA